MNYRKRVKNLMAVLSNKGLKAALVSNPFSVQYFSGFSGTEGVILISSGAAKFLTDFRYQEQAANTLKGTGIELVIFKKKFEALEAEFKRLKLKKLGVEEGNLPLFSANKFEDAGVKLVPIEDNINLLRAIKDGEEIRAIQTSIRIAERAFIDTLKKISVGDSELEVTAFLEYRMKSLGAGKCPPEEFDTIVASAERSAMPHGVASDKKIKHGELVLFDFGCRYKGYCSDLTRVIYMCQTDKEAEKLRKIVLNAQKAAFEKIRPGADVREVDAAARNVIESEGFGKFFGHGLGHGLGLYIHEYPRVSPTGSGKLKEGMVFTVEPGIYLEGQIGVRIEDEVVVTSSGFKILSRLKRTGEVVPCTHHRISSAA